VGAEELLLEESFALGIFVSEEANDLGPDGADGVAVTDDGVKDLGGDGLEKPVDDVASSVSQSVSWVMARRSMVSST
jgi:hypothetical protein